MNKLQLEDLKRYFFEIKAYRKAINGAFVCPKIILAFDKLFLKYERSALPLTKGQLKNVHQELDKLRIYLQDFERFRKLCLTFFDKYDEASVPEDFTTSYQIIKKQASNIFNDFKMGMYFHEGINTALSRLAESMRWFDVELNAVNKLPKDQVVLPPEKAIITSANTTDTITNDLTQNEIHQETALDSPETNQSINGKAHLAPAIQELKVKTEKSKMLYQQEAPATETLEEAVQEATGNNENTTIDTETDKIVVTHQEDTAQMVEEDTERQTIPLNVAALYEDLEPNGLSTNNAIIINNDVDERTIEEEEVADNQTVEPIVASNIVEQEMPISDDLVKNGAIVREMYEVPITEKTEKSVVGEVLSDESFEEAEVTVRITESPTLPFPNPIMPEQDLTEQEANEQEGIPAVKQTNTYFATANPIEPAANLTKIPDLPTNTSTVAPISPINRPKATNFISYNVPLLSSDYVSHFFQQNPSMTSDLNRNHLEQIRQAFHRMKGEEIKAYIDSREYPYTSVLNQLQQALLSMEEMPIKAALKGLKQQVQPFVINTPINYQTLHDKVIHIQGTAEPSSIVCLNVNYESELQQRVDANGQFEFKHVELNFGKNTVIGHNKDFLFLDNFRYYLHLDLERNYRFIGRMDPMTQKSFQADEVDMIWRCHTCRNFMYSYSVSENHGYCTYPNCSSRNFEQENDTGFWTE